MSCIISWKHFLKNPATEDDREILAITRQTAAAVVTHLLDNDLRLIDVHGHSTQWAKWFVDYFADWDGPDQPWRHPSYAYTDAALNAAEWMCILRVAQELLQGCAEYEAVYARVSRAYELCYAPFDGVTDRMSEVEQLAQTVVVFILLHNLCFIANATGDRRREVGNTRAFQRSKQVGIAQHRRFDRFRHTVAPFFFG